MEGLTLALDTKDKLFHLSAQLGIRDLSSAPAMHAEVALRVEVTIGKQASLTPPSKCLSLLVMEERNDALLVVNICFVAHVWVLHLVDGLLEELFILANKQFLNTL